jgi:hypothetical protein
VDEAVGVAGVAEVVIVLGVAGAAEPAGMPRVADAGGVDEAV